MTRFFRMGQKLPVVMMCLALAACAGLQGEEPLYVLRDSSGRSVAMAGRSQLGEAPPGTIMRVNIGGMEQEVMVGERIGMGPVMAARPAAEPLAPASLVMPVAAVAPVAVTSPEPVSRRSTRRARAVPEATTPMVTGANPSGRRRGPPPRSISRSVM